MAGRTLRHPGIPPAHPGEVFREIVLPALARPKAEVARLLGISRQALHAILSERAPVTPEMAMRFGKLAGNGPALWINLQAAHDLWRVERSVDVSHIPDLRAEGLRAEGSREAA